MIYNGAGQDTERETVEDYDQNLNDLELNESVSESDLQNLDGLNYENINFLDSDIQIDENLNFQELDQQKVGIVPDQETVGLLKERFVQNILQNCNDKQNAILKQKLQENFNVRKMKETIMLLQNENSLLQDNIAMFKSQSEHSLELLRGRQLEQAK